MIRLTLALIALAIGVSPMVSADPYDDEVFCAEVAREMQHYPETKGAGVLDCHMLAITARAHCRFLSHGGDYQEAITASAKDFHWPDTAAIIVLVYAVRDFCPQYVNLLPPWRGEVASGNGTPPHAIT